MDPHLAAQERALKYLDLVRNEFRQRIELKQQVLTAYVLGLAAIVGFVIQGYKTNHEYAHILWLIPLLSLSAATFFADHMLVTTSLSQYIKDELEPRLKTDHAHIKFWDRADQMKPLTGIFRVLNAIEWMLLCGPVIALLVFHWILQPKLEEIWLGSTFEVLLSGYATLYRVYGPRPDL